MNISHVPYTQSSNLPTTDRSVPQKFPLGKNSLLKNSKSYKNSLLKMPTLTQSSCQFVKPNNFKFECNFTAGFEENLTSAELEINMTDQIGIDLDKWEKKLNHTKSDSYTFLVDATSKVKDQYQNDYKREMDRSLNILNGPTQRTKKQKRITVREILGGNPSNIEQFSPRSFEVLPDSEDNFSGLQLGSKSGRISRFGSQVGNEKSIDEFQAA
jgi:hypothetical protein